MHRAYVDTCDCSPDGTAPLKAGGMEEFCLFLNFQNSLCFPEPGFFWAVKGGSGRFSWTTFVTGIMWLFHCWH